MISESEKKQLSGRATSSFAIEIKGESVFHAEKGGMGFSMQDTSWRAATIHTSDMTNPISTANVGNAIDLREATPLGMSVRSEPELGILKLTVCLPLRVEP